MRHHKAGTLGEQCAGEEKKVVEKPADPTEDVPNPWGYNLAPPPIPVKLETEVKTEEVKEEKPENGAEKSEQKTESGDRPDEINDKEALRTEVDDEKKVSDLVKVKEEPLDLEGDVKIKQEPIDGEIPSTKREPYADGIYKAAPIVLDSDSDEFEPESDESAPSDDDVETHLGMLRRNPFKEKAKKRKRRKAVPANATVLYIKNAAGQKIKKYSTQKESNRWVPPHPWVPYKNQVTVEQVCQFLEMVDYPIAMNEVLKEKFKDKQAFDDYARPLFQKVNPNAHPLTLMTLIKAKWFEVMNTYTEKEKDESSHTEEKERDESSHTEEKEKVLTIQVEPNPYKVSEVKRPVLKKIKLNWTL